MENELICLCDRPELIETAASMNDSLTANAVPPLVCYAR